MTDIAGIVTAGVSIASLVGISLITFGGLLNRIKTLEKQVNQLQSEVSTLGITIAHLETKIDLLLSRNLRNAMDA